MTLRTACEGPSLCQPCYFFKLWHSKASKVRRNFNRYLSSAIFKLKKRYLINSKMGVAKDIHEIHTDAEYNSSSYVILYILGRAFHIVSPIENTHLYYEKFPFLRIDGNCSKYCKTYHFTETYGPGSKRERECQYVDRSVCEYYPTVIGRGDSRLSFDCKQYMLTYKIFDTVIPTLNCHKGYENYLPILARMLSATYRGYLFRRVYRDNLLKFRTGCDIVGKVVEEYVDSINSKKENYISNVSLLLKGGRKYASNFHSKLEELRTTNTVVDGKLVAENIEKNAALFKELSRETKPHAGCSVMSEYSTDLLELVKIIRILGTSHGTPYVI